MQQSNHLKVMQALEMLGSNATSKAISEAAGVSMQTVDRIVSGYGYIRSGKGLAWVKMDPTTGNGQPELVEAVNRLGDIMEQMIGQAPAAPRMEQATQAGDKPSTINKFVYEFRLMAIEEKDLETVGKNMPPQSADYLDRDYWARRVLSYLFAPELQKQ